MDGEDQEAMDYLEPEKYEVMLDTDIKLRDVFKEYHQCVYTYDFGDNWEHIICLEKVEKSANRNPILLERSGERPPEDVGGEGGFEEYMRIISNEEDPDYESIIQWAQTTKEKKMPIEEINKNMRWLAEWCD